MRRFLKHIILILIMAFVLLCCLYCDNSSEDQSSLSEDEKEALQGLISETIYTNRNLMTEITGGDTAFVKSGDNAGFSVSGSITAQSGSGQIQSVSCLGNYIDSKYDYTSTLNFTNTHYAGPPPYNFNGENTISMTGYNDGYSFTVNANLTVTGEDWSGSINCNLSLTVEQGELVAYSGTVNGIQYNWSSGTTANPSFSIPSGAYSTAQNIILTSSTAGAAFKYTTDGSDPKISDTAVIGSTISVTDSMSIKAYAYLVGLADSDVVTASYTIGDQVAAPTFSLPEGSYNDPQTLSLTAITSGASISYTTDGTDPTNSDTAQVYTSSFTVDSTMTVRAYAAKSGMTNSNIVEISYTIVPPAVADPTFSIAGGTYIEAQTVTLSTTTEGATIKYTTDSSDPTTSDTAIEGTSVSVPISLPIKAYAYKAGMSDSEVITQIYTIEPTVASPTFSIAGGEYDLAQTVILSTSTAGAAIKYTSDGSDPKTSDTAQIGTTINVDNSMPIKAYAYRAGMTASIVVMRVYNIKAADPVFTVLGGSYTSAQTLSLSTTTTSAEIKYTTNGSDPKSSDSSQIYTGSITIDSSITIRAYASKTGVADSNIVTQTYVINLPQQLEPVTFTPNSGFASLSVTLSSPTIDATIKYTTDDSDPKTSDTAQIGNIVTIPGGGAKIKAYAYKTDMADSDVTSESFYLEIEPNNDASSNATPFAFSSFFYGIATNIEVEIPDGPDDDLLPDGTEIRRDQDHYEAWFAHTLNWKIVLDNYPSSQSYSVELLTAGGTTVFNVTLGNGTNEYAFNLGDLGYSTTLYRIRITNLTGGEGDYDYRFKIVLD